MNITKLSRKELKAVIHSYIINAIDGECYDKELNTDTEKLQFVAACFKDQYLFPDNLKRYGTYQEVFRQWLMGLPSCFSIDYESHRIVEIAKEWGSIPVDANDKQEDKIIDNWFNYIAYHTIKLMEKHNVSIY